MTANTGLLTTRCDPYGYESSIQLVGGLYDEKHLGPMAWNCTSRAEARYRMICQGGQYGSGPKPYVCEGGHKGQVMALCRKCARDLGWGPPRPGYRRDGTAYGQIGGTKANEMCPRCMWPGEAAQLEHLMTAVQAEFTTCVLIDRRRVLGQQLEAMRTRMDELNLTGVIHKCPLRLIEVS